MFCPFLPLLCRPFSLIFSNFALFLCFFVFIHFSTVSAAATLSEDLVEFLFQHQQICGSPFSDAQWVPVLDLCEIKCDEEREICVENDEMKQKCTKLPDACVRLWISYKSANLRSSNVVVINRLPPQRPNQNSGRNATTSQQQQQRNSGRDRNGTERRNASERRRSPAQMAAKKVTTVPTTEGIKTVPTMTKMKTEVKPTKKMAGREMEGKGKKGAEERSKDRWTLVPVRRKEDGQKRTNSGNGKRGPQILQSVIELLREE